MKTVISSFPKSYNFVGHFRLTVVATRRVQSHMPQAGLCRSYFQRETPWLWCRPWLLLQSVWVFVVVVFQLWVLTWTVFSLQCQLFSASCEWGLFKASHGSVFNGPHILCSVLLGSLVELACKQKAAPKFLSSYKCTSQ